MTLRDSIENYVLDEGVTDDEGVARSMADHIMWKMDFTFLWEQVDQVISEIKATGEQNES